VIIGVPAHFDLLGRVSGPAQWPELRVAVSAGERMDARILETFERLYGIRLGQVYGMTEVGIISGDLAGDHRPPVVGRPAPGIHVEIVDGLVHVRLPRSPYLFGTGDGRYAEGRLNTGDVGEWASEGVLAVTGRSDSRVTIGGLKVDLTAVEAALCEHELVREAVVVYDGGVVAYVGAPPELTADQLVVWCRSRLAAYETPRRFVVAEHVPRNATGKLLRSAERLRAASGAAPS
jgi:acyl-coenzyme A synthetase/AMP-(fatty) acid ligase